VASFRRPKGTVVRSFPDWNINKLAYNNDWFVGLTSTNTLTVLLFNDNNVGKNLIVWALDIVHYADNWPKENGIPANGGMLVGVGTATFVSPTLMINPLAAVVSGQVYADTSVFGSPPLTDESRTFGLSAGGYSWPHEWPCAVIPPGWSFGVELHGSESQMAVGFVWEEADAL
jgi:hypothetical protein